MCAQQPEAALWIHNEALHHFFAEVNALNCVFVVCIVKDIHSLW